MKDDRVLCEISNGVVGFWVTGFKDEYDFKQPSLIGLSGTFVTQQVLVLENEETAVKGSISTKAYEVCGSLRLRVPAELVKSMNDVFSNVNVVVVDETKIEFHPLG